MSEKNFMAYGDAESVLTGYANRIKQSPTTFVGTQAQWNALSAAQKAEYTLVDITDDSLSLSGLVDWRSNGELGAKNLFPNNGTTRTVNGITITVNADKSVTFNGTATADFGFEYGANTLDSGDYILSKGSSDISPNLYLYNYATSSVIVTTDSVTEHDNVPFTLNTQTTFTPATWITSGQTFSNVVIKPMIRLATDSDSTYQPYSMTNKGMTPYVQAISNPNLLDNPWFTVNQRGNGAITGRDGYITDRWGYYNAPDGGGTSVTSSDGIRFYGQIVNRYLLQKIPSDEMSFLVGKTLTASILMSDGTIYKGTQTLKETGQTTYISNSLFYAYSIANLNEIFGIAIKPNADITIRAVKLELGSVSTLAMDTAPNYVSELLKCQKYFVRFSAGAISTGLLSAYAYSAGAVRFSVPLPVKMRVFPTISYSNLNDWGISQDSVQNAVSPTSITLATRVEAIMVVDFASNSYIAQTPYVLCCKTAGAYIDFSADL